MPTREVVGLSAVTKKILDTVETFLGNSGSGSLMFKPDVAPNGLSIDLAGAKVNLPSTIDLSYKKAGSQLTVDFAKPITGVIRGISIPVTKATIDTTQIHLSLGGIVGALTSLTLKDAGHD